MTLSTNQTKHTLTSHWTEPVALFCVVVVGGTAPPHAVPAPVGGALGVVLTAVEEGEVAEGAVGVSTSGHHGGCDVNRKEAVSVSFPFCDTWQNLTSRSGASPDFSVQKEYCWSRS